MNNEMNYKAKSTLPKGAGTKDLSSGEPMSDSPAGLGDFGVKGSPKPLYGGTPGVGGGSEALNEIGGLHAKHGLSHLESRGGLKSGAGTPVSIPKDGEHRPNNNGY